MVNLITGVPGSGKTYLAVKFIYDEITSKSPKYRFIYTNINLNFKKCDEIRKGFVKPLNLDDLLQRIEKDYALSELFKQGKLYDEETGELVTDYDSYVRGKLKLFEPYEHSLIILDECHLYFQNSVDNKLLRFLSYHRHFDIDILLITQNKSLINRKYLAFIESMYVGVNPSKRLFSKVFVYKLYASYKESKDNLVSKEKIKFDKRIAECYNSGSTKIHKPLSYKILFPLFLFGLIAFFLFKGLTNKFKCGSFICSDTNIVSNNKISNIPKLPKDVKVTKKEKKEFIRKHRNYSLEDYKYFYILDCFDKKCILNTSFSVSKSLLNFLLKSSKTLLIAIDSSPLHSTYYVATNFDLFKFLRVGAYYDEDYNKKFNYSMFGSDK